jgi:mono/diheme cytochrome c family protein
VAFATGDRDNVEKILQQEEQGKYREDFLYEHALIEIQRGRFQSAERLRLQALGSTPKASNADSWVIPAALEDAEVGKDAQARRYESKAAASPLDRNGKIALAQALARSGRTAEAGAFAQSAGGMLTEKQIDVITTGIRERWSKPDVLNGTNPPPYSSTTPGDSSRGSQVYGTFCSSCHGVVGKGGLKASSIVDGSFLALLNDQELRTIVIVGRPDLGAPDWRNNVPGTSMSAQDVSDVVAWLASQRSKFPGQPYPSTTKSLGEVR